VREERVENDLIGNCSPEELANFLELFPDARRDDRLKVLFGEWSRARFTGFTFLPYVLYFIAESNGVRSRMNVNFGHRRGVSAWG
jgi:hypothetical protein